MKAILNKARVPIKIWTELDKIESAALTQLTNLANLPFVFQHVAVMPDVHVGKGATVGTVLATRGAICPAAVGVDIGCGMAAVKLSLPSEKITEKLSELRQAIEQAIPVGFDSNNSISKAVEKWAGWKDWKKEVKKDADLFQKARKQLGSLGGGNHFIEVCLDTEKHVWLMVHSGSRNVGKTLAERHMDQAKLLMKQHKIHLADPDLAYLSERTPEFDAYLADVHWAQSYAKKNREEMVSRVLNEVARLCNNGEPLKTELQIDCHHNYVERELHFGKKLLITRKGAVSARKGEHGIIPGSMGTRSYIVQGKGNPESFESCSHGAGRKMSRGQAKKTFTVQDLKQQTRGVECRKDSGVLDEIPGAYKPIEEVMANQSDLVEIIAELKQVICIKG